MGQAVILCYGDDVMPGRPIVRDRTVYFLGAGFSKAARLPNTKELLDDVDQQPERIRARLEEAYDYFYPEHGAGFQPDVVDFFSVLFTYGKIGKRLPEGFLHSGELLDDLRRYIAQTICQRSRGLIGEALRTPNEFLDQMIQPGNIVISSNWDIIVERICEARGIPVKLCGRPGADYLLLLKLHGSVDWAFHEKTNYELPSKDDFACLKEPVNALRPYKPPLTGEVYRVRIENPGAAWRTVKRCSRVPLIITMAQGKESDLEPLLPIWKDAYYGISSAEELHIAGYSMPPDDLEIRTLLRAGIKRGNAEATVIVRNQEHQVHPRARQYLSQNLESDYRPIPSFGH